MDKDELIAAYELIYADMDDKGYFDDLNCALQDEPFNGDEPFWWSTETLRMTTTYTTL